MSLFEMVSGNMIEHNLPCCSRLTFGNCEFTGRASSVLGRWACFEVTQDMGFPLPNIIKYSIAVEDMEETLVNPARDGRGEDTVSIIAITITR